MTKKRASDDLLDGLYAAPPREFVAERKRVRDALVAAGRADEAGEVAKRKRPSVSVWAVNQLARRAPDDVAELLDLGASLRAGERKLMQGGSPEGFMDDARTARQKVAAQARRAEAFVAEAGQKPTVTLGRTIAQTLQAAIIGDDDTRERLAAGRLDEDLAPPSTFGSDAPIPARTQRAAPKPKLATAPKPKLATDRADAAAERKHDAADRKRAAAGLREQRRAQAAARKHAAALERAATAAERVAAERTRAVERARAAVERAEADLRAAKDDLVDAESAATAARRAADEAAR